MKTSLPRMILTVCVACLPLAGMSQAHIDVSRSNSFAVTAHAGHQHGAIRNPAGPVWSYYWQPGRYDDGGGYQYIDIRGPGYWTPMGPSGTNFYLQPAAGNGNVWGLPDCLRTYWNVTPSAPPTEWTPSWALAVFTELDRMHVYDIGGKLEWMAGHTASGLYRAASFVIVRAADGSLEPLYSAGLSAAAINVRYTLFDEADPVNYPIPAALKGFTLRRGDMLVIGVRGSSSQYRTVYLYDGAVTLNIVGPRGTMFKAL